MFAPGQLFRLRRSPKHVPPAGGAATTVRDKEPYKFFSQSCFCKARRTKMLNLGENAPDFAMGEGKSFHEWRAGRWTLLISAKALSPTCTVEFAELARLAGEFSSEDIGLVTLLCDPAQAVTNWLGDLADDFAIHPSWPIISDSDLSIAATYGLVDSSGTGLQRASILIDPQGKIAALSAYPITNGRNFSEMLRIALAARLTATDRVATPPEWTLKNGRVMLPPSLPQSEAEKLYSQGVDIVRPYLRFVDLPVS